MSATPNAYRIYDTQYPGVLETVGAVLYDTVTYTSGTTTVLQLFNATRSTIDLSNMEAAGQLPYPKSFLVRAIRFYVKQVPTSQDQAGDGVVQTGALNNIAQLINTGVFTLQIGAKPYFQYPLWAIPSGGGVFGALGLTNIAAGTPIVGTLVDYGVVGLPDARAVLTLTKPILIGPQINFVGTIQWPTPVTLTGSTNITVCLDGDLTRPVQ